MASIPSRETKPEITARKYLFKQGFRFRKNVKTLPGKPDIVLHKYHTVVFIHGCFWHGHKNCKKASRPTTNTNFWKLKIQANIDRDKKVNKELKMLGWRVITLWECKLKMQSKFAETMKTLTLLLKSIQ